VFAATDSFGVYVHVPFCLRRCDYCAFATWDDRPQLIEAYVAAVRRELDEGADAGLRPATSVFFGGGTPSLLTVEQLGRLLAAISLAPSAEVTVECNPDTVSAELLAGYRDAGVTRISLGVQSMVPHVLGALGRTHDVANVRHSVDAIRAAGFAMFNLDLIYGAAGESVADWQRTLEGALALDPLHVSAYALTVEPGTPLADDPTRHPDDDDQADKYVLADEILTAAGLGNYEISNWARPGHECRHNLLYWSQGEYRGFGCAAHSHERGRRWWNVRTPERYIAAIDQGVSAEAAGEELPEDERRIEALQLALRTRLGVPREALPEQELGGLVTLDGDRLVLTRRGRLLANEVALRLR